MVVDCVKLVMRRGWGCAIDATLNTGERMHATNFITRIQKLSKASGTQMQQLSSLSPLITTINIDAL